MILLDTSGLLAALDEAQLQHAACREIVQNARAPLLLSPFVLAELDYLLATRVGQAAELAFLDEVARGAYTVPSFSPEQVGEARQVIQRYRTLKIGLADASLVVLAGQLGVREVLTLDERHFRALRTKQGKRLRIVPADIRH